jgi:hypothetical protein
MSDSTFDRAAALGGAGFVALAAAASAIAPTNMELDTDVAEVRRKISEHADRLGTGALLTALAMVSLGFFLGYLHKRLRASEPEEASSVPACFSVAAAALVTIGMVGAVLQALVAHHVDGFDDSTVLLAFRLWQLVSYDVLAFPAAVVMLLVGVRTVQTAMFPRWIGVVAIVSAILGVVTTAKLWVTGDPVPTALDSGGFVLALVWMVATGIAALVRPPAPLPRPQLA